MVDRHDNIEPIARAICTRELAISPGVDAGKLPGLVDRFWRPVAAELVAGLRDESGRLLPYPIGAGIAAWEAWLDEERQLRLPT